MTKASSSLAESLKDIQNLVESNFDNPSDFKKLEFLTNRLNISTKTTEKAAILLAIIGHYLDYGGLLKIHIKDYFAQAQTLFTHHPNELCYGQILLEAFAIRLLEIPGLDIPVPTAIHQPPASHIQRQRLNGNRDYRFSLAKLHLLKIKSYGTATPLAATLSEIFSTMGIQAAMFDFSQREAIWLPQSSEELYGDTMRKYIAHLPSNHQIKIHSHLEIPRLISVNMVQAEIASYRFDLIPCSAIFLFDEAINRPQFELFLNVLEGLIANGNL